jgi:hypothetical protein
MGDLVMSDNALLHKSSIKKNAVTPYGVFRYNGYRFNLELNGLSFEAIESIGTTLARIIKGWEESQLKQDEDAIIDLKKRLEAFLANGMRHHLYTPDDAFAFIVMYSWIFNRLEGGREFITSVIGTHVLNKQACVIVPCAKCENDCEMFPKISELESYLVYHTGICIDCHNAAQFELIETPQSRLRAMPYNQYLQTKHWKKTRQLALDYAGHACQICNASGVTLDVHHRTYERLGNEQVADLTVLCRSCHSTFHGKGV